MLPPLLGFTPEDGGVTFPKTTMRHAVAFVYDLG